MDREDLLSAILQHNYKLILQSGVQYSLWTNSDNKNYQTSSIFKNSPKLDLNLQFCKSNKHRRPQKVLWVLKGKIHVKTVLRTWRGI